MDVGTGLRRAAASVMESAIRIAPEDAREWGQAMRRELDSVEGAWAAVEWSLGGAGVLMKRALAVLFVRAREGELLSDGLFARRVSLRRTALVAGGAFALAALVFFAAPPFRQGLGISLAAWAQLTDSWMKGADDGVNHRKRLEALAERAQLRGDPEGLVFAAARLDDAAESARCAAAAVRLDPGFVWASARRATLPCGILRGACVRRRRPGRTATELYWGLSWKIEPSLSTPPCTVAPKNTPPL